MNAKLVRGAAVGAALLVLALAPAGFGQELHPTLKVDGLELLTDVPAFVDQDSGRTLAPVRLVAEALGYRVRWEPYDQSVILDRPDSTITFSMDKAEAVVNGKYMPLDVAPRMVRNRAMVPLRFLAERAGARVGWDAGSLAVALSSPTSAGQPPETGWTHARGGPRRTGYNPNSTIGARVRLLWNSQVGPTLGEFQSEVAAGEGLVFVSGHDKALYALDAATGRSVWKANVPSVSMPGSPSFSDLYGQVYVTTQDPNAGGRIYTFDARTGEQLWFAAIPNSADRGSPVAAGDKVLVPAYGSWNSISAFDAGTGSYLWSQSGSFGRIPTVSGVRLLSPAGEDALTVRRLTDGAEMWRQAAQSGQGQAWQTQALVAANGLIFSMGAGGVQARDEATGTLVWNQGQIAGSAAATDGKDLWVSTPNGLALLNAGTGEILHRPAICSRAASAPVMNPTHVFTACDGHIYAVDRTTFQVTQLAAGAGPLALDGDRLYYASGDPRGDGQRLAALQAAR